MTTQYRLDEKDLIEAVILWMRSHGNQPASATARVYLGVDPGDPPLSLPTMYATAYFETQPND